MVHIKFNHLLLSILSIITSLVVVQILLSTLALRNEITVNMYIGYIFPSNQTRFTYLKQSHSPSPINRTIYVSPSKYFNLSSWSLQRPIEPPFLNSKLLTRGYASKYFYYDSSDKSMVFMCPNEGAHTRTSNFPRSELKQTQKFYVYKGYYYQNATIMISNTSHKSIGNTYDYTLCIAQIHGMNDALPLVMVYWDSNNTQIYANYKLNGYLITERNKSETKRIDLEKVAMNNKFTLSMIVHDGNISIYLNSIKYLETNVSEYWIHKNYFKIGNYPHQDSAINMSLYTQFFTEVKVFKLINIHHYKQINATNDVVLKMVHHMIKKHKKKHNIHWKHYHRNSRAIKNFGVDFKHVTLCIGVQKGGTTTLRRLLSQIPDIYPAKSEYHYFDGFHESSLNKTMKNFYDHGENGRKFIMKLRKEVSELKSTKIAVFKEFWEKTPENFFFPHIAYIVSNDMIKYGSKVFVLLRDPLKRFVSAYWHYYIKSGFKIPDIMQYLNVYVYRDELNSGGDSHVLFNKDMNQLYDEYTNTSTYAAKLNVYNDMVQRFGRFVYSWKPIDVRPYNIRSLWIWIRTCYVVQLLPWIVSIEQLQDQKRYKHSFKIIQFERLFDVETRETQMKYINCYIHYHYDEVDEYGKYMEDCIKNSDEVNVKFVQINNKTGGHTTNKELSATINESYGVCNNWLRSMLDVEYPHLILGGFDWDRWSL